MRTPTIIVHHGHRRIDEHDFAIALTEIEGGAVNNNVAQCSELSRCALDMLGRLWANDPAAVVETLERHRPKRRPR